jgi:hypothetical protein
MLPAGEQYCIRDRLKNNLVQRISLPRPAFKKIALLANFFGSRFLLAFNSSYSFIEHATERVRFVTLAPFLQAFSCSLNREPGSLTIRFFWRAEA